MIIHGNFESLEINDLFYMEDENGVQVLEVSCNKNMPGKIFIKSPGSDTKYLGEIAHNHHSEEFALYKGDLEILRIKQPKLSLPKFEITSSVGDFSTKFILREKKLVLFEGEKEILSFHGNPPDYRLHINDDCNTFYAMSIAYGITTLLPSKLLYQLLKKI